MSASKLTKPLHAAIVAGTYECGYVEVAARSNGVGHSTLHLWLSQGRSANAREPYKSFAEDVDRAKAEFAGTLVREIVKAAPKDWKAAAWMLAKMDPARWGDKIDIRVRDEVTAEIERLAAELGVADQERSEVS